jgi:tetratricopeptide (TPR) repeat protein
MALPLMAQTTPDRMAEHAQAARQAEARNDFPTAVREYEALAKLLPRSAEVQSNLGVALYFNHDMTGSAAASQRAISLNPNLFAPHLFLGLARYRLSDPDRAAPELEKAVRLNGSDKLAHTWLGYAYVAQLRYEAAAKEFEAVCRLDPNNVDAWYALGQSYLQIGKDTTLKLLAAAPDSGRVWQLAGEQYQLQGNRQRALEAYQGAARRRPDIPELRSLIASMGGAATDVAGAPAVDRNTEQEDDLYRQAHDAEQQSQMAFSRVLQIAPDSYRAHQIMADAFVAEGQRDQAIQEYRTVLKLKPDLPGIHEALGNNLLRNGKLPEALKEFRAELELQPRSATAHMNVGRALSMSGDDDGARKMLTAALHLDRPPLETYSLLGKIDLRSQQYRQAIAMLTHYVSITKDDSDAYYLLVRAYRAVGDRDRMNQALELYKKTSRDAKERSLAQKELGTARDKSTDSVKDADLKATAAQ